jgi:hypothetical protein
MQLSRTMNGQMRAVAMALGGAIVTSVIAMFIPVGVFENITGSTGISELIPATGAPLGDTARAMIAFGFGVLAFLLFAAPALRQPRVAAPARPAAAKVEPVEQADDDTPSFFESMKAKLSDFAASRRNDNAVTELSDLPKLRPGDAHPDAPPRRPISANTDFAELIPQPVSAPIVAAESEQVADMVDRLEAAVATRENQLSKLEAIAKAEAAKPHAVKAEVVETEIMAPSEPAFRPIRLEAVPSEPSKSSGGDEMDAALRSALETLHRMNARTR